MQVRTSLVLLAAAVFAGLAVACSGPQPSGDVRNGPAGDGATRIAADDSFFRPQSLELPAGENVTLEIANEGGIPHDFSIDEVDISTGVIEPGGVRTITFEVPDGTTRFVCKLHGGMDGTIVAVDRHGDSQRDRLTYNIVSNRRLDHGGGHDVDLHSEEFGQLSA